MCTKIDWQWAVLNRKGSGILYEQELREELSQRKDGSKVRKVLTGCNLKLLWLFVTGYP